MPLFSYKELIVWQRSVELAKSVYFLTRDFPSEERFGLISQIRRSAISIPSNIAEGRSRGTRLDFIRFLKIAYGSGAELETQIEIAKEVFRVKISSYTKTETLLGEVMKMLNVMIKRMNSDSIKAN